MAKLLVVDPAKPGVLEPDGYVNVVRSLIENSNNYKDFLDAQPDDRADILQGYAGTNAHGVQLKVQQLTADGKDQDISGDNCWIIEQQDRLKQKHKRHSLATVPMPTDPIPKDTDFNYLLNYAKQIHDLYDTDQTKCVLFLFGAMMLTRCR